MCTREAVLLGRGSRAALTAVFAGALAAGLSAGCGGPVTLSEDAGPPRSEDGGPAAACARPITGEEPFGVTVRGEAALTAPHRTDRVMHLYALHVYFPEGRRAGAPVVASLPVSWPRSTVVSVAGELDAEQRATLSVGGFDASGGGRARMQLDVLPPGRGVAARIEQELTPSDALSTVSGEAVLCADGPAPAPEVSFAPDAPGPLSDLWAAASVPLADGVVALATSAGRVERPALAPFPTRSRRGAWSASATPTR